MESKHELNDELQCDICGHSITVGANAIIGMGSTVTKSVEAGITVAGNPARLFEKKK